jgi:low affinity Fe/Cu permease
MRRMFPRPLRPKSSLGQTLERLSHAVTAWTGSSWAFALAAAVIIVWLISGPLFHFSDTWQLVINTGTTIVTFLMVFLIQRTQNKDSLAIQLKLNEIVAAIPGASNRLIDIEDLSEAELIRLHQFYGRLAELAKHEADLLKSHSIEEAELHHKHKGPPHKPPHKDLPKP